MRLDSTRTRSSCRDILIRNGFGQDATNETFRWIGTCCRVHHFLFEPCHGHNRDGIYNRPYNTWSDRWHKGRRRREQVDGASEGEELRRAKEREEDVVDSRTRFKTLDCDCHDESHIRVECAKRP